MSCTLLFGSPYRYDANLIANPYHSAANVNGYASIPTVMLPVLISATQNFVRYSRPFAPTHRPDRIQYPALAPSGDPYNNFFLNGAAYNSPAFGGQPLNSSPLNSRGFNS